MRGVSGGKKRQSVGRQVEREDAASNSISVTRGSDGESAERARACTNSRVQPCQLHLRPAVPRRPPVPDDDDDDDSDLRRLRDDIPIPSAPRVKW